MAWSGPLAVAAILAMAAGVAKLLRPQPVVVALRGIGASVASPALVRLGSLLELALGGLALGSGWTPAVVGLGATYLAFAAFVAVARSTPGMASCACFGETDAPPSWRHVILDVGLAGGCAGAVMAGTPGVASVLVAQPLAGAPFVIVSLLAAWLAYVVLSGPQVTALSSSGSAS